MSSPESNHWHFLTNHAQVLLCMRNNQDVRMRDIAETVGITERAAQRITNDLVASGYVTRERIGRRNRYQLNPNAVMRHPAQREHAISELLELLSSEEPVVVETPVRGGLG
jgi:DNA-binding MarR family transcriptional regulator